MAVDFLFNDRRDAGKRLAMSLYKLRSKSPVVAALLRGGVPVALEVARTLRAPIDLLVVRKIGAPGQPELGVGAIAEDERPYFQRGILEALGLEPRDLDSTVRQEVLELRRRVDVYRKVLPKVDFRNRVVVVVDDGLATGVTAVAASRFIRAQGAQRVILAVPVGSGSTVERLRSVFDEIYCLEKPEPFLSVGQWYRDFSQLTDLEIVELLKARRGKGAAA